MGPGILFNSLDMRREILLLEALYTSAKVGRRRGVLMDEPAVLRREETELRRGDRPRRQRIEHQRFPDGISIRPFLIVSDELELFGRGLPRRDRRQDVVLPHALIRQHDRED